MVLQIPFLKKNKYIVNLKIITFWIHCLIVPNSAARIIWAYILISYTIHLISIWASEYPLFPNWILTISLKTTFITLQEKLQLRKYLVYYKSTMGQGVIQIFLRKVLLYKIENSYSILIQKKKWRLKKMKSYLFKKRNIFIRKLFFEGQCVVKP